MATSFLFCEPRDFVRGFTAAGRQSASLSELRPKNQKPPICIGGSEKLRTADLPPLHERTFAHT
jgi:hypothetical protein